MFKSGEAIVHPVRGAGVVEGIVERTWRGDHSLYYRIKLLNQPTSSLMIPIKAADSIGLRRAISSADLKSVWDILYSHPHSLPSNHKKRYQILEDKLYAGDIWQVAEAVRDMTWRQQQEGSLTTRGKRMYKEGIKLLAGEIAASQGIELTSAEMEIRDRLAESTTPASVA
ncbi:MAG TPA: hypothetical protein ENN19_03850 [Chloroflexi bacterium]|nr:hypothetical protein [Chloroflexota bacterium]